MADETKETHILKFEVQQGDAIQELERTKKSIISLKEEQGNLQKAYKAGAITLDEYASETVRVEALLKKQTNTYGTLQKQVTGIKTPFDKLTESMKSQAEQVKVGGVSVGELGTKIASLANPVTAAVTLFGSLAAVYARSTTGTKDLEFAHNQLSAAITIVSNKFANLFSSAEDGEGIISRLFNQVLLQYLPTVAIQSRAIAANMEKLEDLQRERLKIEQNANDLLDENATLMERIADSTVSNNEKLQLTNQAVHNLRDIEAERVKNSEAQLDFLRVALSLDKDNESIQTQVLEKELEISKIKKDIEKRVSSIEKMESNIQDAKAKELESEIQIARAKERAGSSSKDIEKTQIKNIATTDAQIKLQEKLAKQTEITTKKTLTFSESQKLLTEQQRDQALASQAMSQSLNVAAGLFEKNTAAYKIIASAQATMDAYRSFTLATATYPPPFGEILGAASLAAGLAAVAKINGVEFSEGGYTGPGGKYTPKGIVHAGEVVWNQSDVAAVGGPAMANRMRPTYSDGGIVAQNMTSNVPVQSMQNIDVALTYREFKEFMTAMKYKENLVTR